MNNKPYLIHSMRYLGICLLVFFAINLSFATTPPATDESDPCYRDKKAPHIKCPDDITVWIDCDEECTEVECWSAKAWDDCDEHPEIHYDVDRDYCFREGTTEVWAWAVDKSGNESEKCGFNVTVKQKRDKEPPRIKCPDDVTVYIDCDEKCTKVDFGYAEVWDNCDPHPEVYYDVDEHYCFREGTTEVWAWAVDKSGNESKKCGFNVTVKRNRDTEPPHIKCPDDIVVYVDCGVTCAYVKCSEAKARDNCDPHPRVWCDIDDRKCYPLGTTEVWCYAKDKSGNESKCSYTITVKERDNTPPVITCPWPTGIDLYVNCGLTCSRIMWWMEPTVRDDCDKNPKVWCEAKGKSIDKWYCFPLGATVVTCYAQDKAGNKSSCTYTVTVKEQNDYVPPVITCPKDIMAMSDRYKTCKEVNFAATATDNCTTPTITYTVYTGTAEVDIKSGYCFPMGKSRVIATAKDKAGNTASCTFYVTVMGFGDLVKTVNDGTESATNSKNKVGENLILLTENNTLNLPTNQREARKEFAIYPNPTNNFVNLDLHQYQGKNVTVNVLNAVGQQMYSTTLKEVADQPYRIDMQEYPSGMYLFRISGEGMEPMAKKVLRH